MANYDVNYNDERFRNVETEKNNTLNEANSMYNNMINNSDAKYNELIQASKDYANTQQTNQQARTDFAIEKINQEKDKANKDYIKEQKGAYTDWQKESNRYGSNAEALASQGLSNSGYSESSQVNMYNTYQNRVAQARENYNQAVLNYNNAIKDAQLSNNEVMAEIAYNALQKQLELALQGFEYKNTLLQSQLSSKLAINNEYYNRYKDVLNQINQENQFRYQQERDRIADEQYREKFEYQKQRDAVADAQWKKQYELSKKASASRSSSSGSTGKKSTGGNDVSVNDENTKSETVKVAQDVVKGLAKVGTTAMALGTGVKSGNILGVTKILKNVASDSLYNAYQNGKINEEEANAIAKKLGL